MTGFDTSTLPHKTIIIIKDLEDAGVLPILYGSQGVSLYIGAYKDFGDVDLLVDDNWLNNRWPDLIKIMGELGYKLQDEHEHEFIDPAGTVVAFAGKGILARDGITNSLEGIVKNFAIGGTTIATLRIELFKKAYEFSAHDGYRKEVRGKKDSDTVALIDDFISNGGVNGRF